jgi:hypothetical protein
MDFSLFYQEAIDFPFTPDILSQRMGIITKKQACLSESQAIFPSTDFNMEHNRLKR